MLEALLFEGYYQRNPLSKVRRTEQIGYKFPLSNAKKNHSVTLYSGNSGSGSIHQPATNGPLPIDPRLRVKPIESFWQE
jgi:hypothetical protein